jgi:hypothetical protein
MSKDNLTIADNADVVIKEMSDHLKIDLSSVNTDEIFDTINSIGGHTFDCGALQRAITQSSCVTMKSLARDLTMRYVIAIREARSHKEEQSVETIFYDENDDLSITYQYSPLCTLMLPSRENQDKEIVVSHPAMSLRITGDDGIPYGAIARLIIMYCNKIAVKYNTRQIRLGRSFSEFIRNIGYAPKFESGKVSEKVIEQVERLFHTTFYLKIREERPVFTNGQEKRYTKTLERRFNFFETKVDIVEQFSSNSNVYLQLDKEYFEQLTSHPVPLDFDTLLALKRSVMAMDLYAFITYRSGSKDVFTTIEQLQLQFHNDDLRSKFKKDLKRALELIKKNWVECKASIGDKTLFIPAHTRHIKHSGFKKIK